MSEEIKASTKPLEARRLPFDRLAAEETEIVAYAVTMPYEHKYEDLFRPDYWAHHAAKFRRAKTKLVVVNDDCTFYAELFVVNCDRGWAQVRELFKTELPTEVDSDAVSDYKVEWKGPKRLFCVIRKNDNISMKENLIQKIDAQKYAFELQRGTAAA